MTEYEPFYIYFSLIAVITLLVVSVSSLFPTRIIVPEKYAPYESGIVTETALLQERFPLRHYLVALMFLVFDVEVIFLFPWAIIAKEMGSFAFYEMGFFLLISFAGLTYVWKKKGLQWE